MTDSAQKPPRLLDRVRAVLRVRHYSRRTEDVYVGWIRRYIRYHGIHHPDDMGSLEVVEFLSDLAVRGRVAASTQNQALAALLFLYRDVPGRDLEGLDGAVRARHPRSLPVVLSRDEVRAVLSGIEGVQALAARLMYGAGLRLLECLRLRVRDIEPERRHTVVAIVERLTGLDLSICPFCQQGPMHITATLVPGESLPVPILDSS